MVTIFLRILLLASYFISSEAKCSLNSGQFMFGEKIVFVVRRVFIGSFHHVLLLSSIRSGKFYHVFVNVFFVDYN